MTELHPRTILEASGQCLSDTKANDAGRLGTSELKLQTARSPTAIQFVRSRMFYARAALNSEATVTMGLKHIRKTYCLKILLSRDLTQRRRAESVQKCLRRKARFAPDEIHFPTAIRASQRLHLSRKSSRNNSAFQRLYLT